MLYKRISKARRALQSNMPQESNFEGTYYEDEEKRTGRKEEVLVGHNYIDDNSGTDNTLGEGYPIADPKSPNDLDPDLDVEDEEDSSNEEVDKEARASITNLSEYAEALQTPSMEQKEESMDALNSCPYKKEDTSGNTDSNVTKFLEKYADGNDVMQILRKDLMALLSDMQWIIESNNVNEQWAEDFKKALNEMSLW